MSQKNIQFWILGVVLVTGLALAAACQTPSQTTQGGADLCQSKPAGPMCRSVNGTSTTPSSPVGKAAAVYVYGLPSGRYIRSIPVYEPRAGYGYANVPGTETYERLAASGPMWGDTHHPILSESGGDYDGKWLWINDKANSRIARIDLRTFETKAIAKIPNLQATHGIAVISPDTSYVIANGEFRAEVPPGSVSVDNYGAIMAFLDPETLVPQFEVLMPGNCDINDSSKDGRWAFTTIYNLEEAVTVEGMIQREEDAIGRLTSGRPKPRWSAASSRRSTASR